MLNLKLSSDNLREASELNREQRLHRATTATNTFAEARIRAAEDAAEADQKAAEEAAEAAEDAAQAKIEADEDAAEAAISVSRGSIRGEPKGT